MIRLPAKVASILPFLAAASLCAAVVRYLIDQELDSTEYLLVAAGVLFFLLFGSVRPGSLRHVAIIRTLLYPALILVALAVINLAAGRCFFRFDLTEMRGYSLAQPTLNALAKVKEPISITAFLRQSDYRSEIAAKLLGEYADHSKWITYEIVDPDVRPSTMQEKGVTSYGTVLFESGAKRRDISSVDEQSITNTIVRLTDVRPPVVYFTTGHGERDTEGEQRDGYSILKWHLENNAYIVNTVALGSVVLAGGCVGNRGRQSQGPLRQQPGEAAG